MPHPMVTFIVSDDASIGSRARLALIGQGRECPPSNLIGVDQARRHLQDTNPELVVLAVGSDADSAMASVSRVRALVSGRILVVGGLASPREVLKVLRAGADDYVDAADLDSELGSALAHLTNARGWEQQGRVIAVVSPSGGGGASTVAVNLASALAMETKAKPKRDVGLIDLRLASGDLAAMLDLQPEHTLLDLCMNIDRVDRSLFERTLSSHESGVKLLASPRRFEETEPITPSAVASVLELARGAFPFVVADLDGGLPETSMETLRLADEVLVVLRLEFGSLCNARHAIEHMERRGVVRSRIKLVANRKNQPREVPIAKVEEALGSKFEHLIPDDPKAAIQSANNGSPMVRALPSSRASKAILKMAAAIRDAVPAAVEPAAP